MRYLQLRKHPYGACGVIEMVPDYYILISYATVVASCFHGKVTRHWPNSSRTTSKHFYAFCNEYAESWDRWDNMEPEKFPLDYDLECIRGKLELGEAGFTNYPNENGGKYFRIRFFPKPDSEYLCVSSDDVHSVTDEDIEFALTTSKFVKNLKGE